MLALSIFTHISVHIFICQQKVIMKGKNLLTAIGEKKHEFSKCYKSNKSYHLVAMHSKTAAYHA